MLPTGYPDLAVSLNNVGAAMDAATAAAISVIVVQQVAPEKSPIFARGSRGFALHEWSPLERMTISSRSPCRTPSVAPT